MEALEKGPSYRLTGEPKRPFRRVLEYFFCVTSALTLSILDKITPRNPEDFSLRGSLLPPEMLSRYLNRSVLKRDKNI